MMHSGDLWRWWSERTRISSPDKNMSKIHMPVEQILLKTNWNLGEGLLYKQPRLKERHPCSRAGSKEKWLGREPVPRARRGKREVSQADTHPGKGVGQATDWMPHSRVLQGEVSPFGSLEDFWHNRSLALDLGQPQLGILNCEMQRQPGPRAGPTAGAYLSSESEAVHISDGRHSTTAHASTTQTRVCCGRQSPSPVAPQQAARG